MGRFQAGRATEQNQRQVGVKANAEIDQCLDPIWLKQSLLLAGISTALRIKHDQ